MKSRLSGKVALVTGSSAGIGRASAEFEPDLCAVCLAAHSLRDCLTSVSAECASVLSDAGDPLACASRVALPRTCLAPLSSRAPPHHRA